MEQLLIKNLVSQIIAAALDPETLPVRTPDVYAWQDFAIVSDADAADLDTMGIAVKGTIYESGTIQLVITKSKSKSSTQDAYKRLKAKNLVLVSIDRAGDAKRAEDESTELLEKAADMLGITPAQALEMVNKSDAKQ